MRKGWFVLMVAFSVLILAACGAKSQEDVTEELSAKLDDMEGYKASAQMTLQVGKEPQTYEVEVWYSKPKQYRVQLKNVEKDQSQIILRNKEGVFVLTPALNKSFKFQSNWPENSSQAYLFESLVKDILQDKEAKFTASEDHYVFETETRYKNNQMLPVQEISFNKKDLTPASVKVMDSDRNALVTVEFSKVDLKAKFDANSFDMDKNMSGANLEVPVMADLAEEEMTVLYPMEMPGANLVDEKEVATENGKRVVMTFDGEKSYTLIQEKTTEIPEIAVPTSVSGELVDLGFTVGAINETSIFWSYDGVDYMLASNDLTEDEMVSLAKSVQGSVVK
ncbi:outer membrane lipoprotein carrier protein LolA [Bacillus spongiae]|uniref:Outer membrane lipoprotein carrier protein LolA n=1 Tax=Bacillus spongiae TaxID=2683610 RepID=A0ABU8HIZ9_9BACI